VINPTYFEQLEICQHQSLKEPEQAFPRILAFSRLRVRLGVNSDIQSSEWLPARTLIYLLALSAVQSGREPWSRIPLSCTAPAGFFSIRDGVPDVMPEDAAPDEHTSASIARPALEPVGRMSNHHFAFLLWLFASSDGRFATR
jgi:hypothetical protein